MLTHESIGEATCRQRGGAAGCSLFCSLPQVTPVAGAANTPQHQPRTCETNAKMRTSAACSFLPLKAVTESRLGRRGPCTAAAALPHFESPDPVTHFWLSGLAWSFAVFCWRSSPEAKELLYNSATYNSTSSCLFSLALDPRTESRITAHPSFPLPSFLP